MFHLFSFLLPFAVRILERYVDSTDSKKDDEILEVVKTATNYLACKDNNTLSLDSASACALAKIK